MELDQKEALTGLRQWSPWQCVSGSAYIFFLYIKSKARFSKFEIFMLNKGMRRNFLIYCNSLFILQKNLNFSIKIQCCYVHVQTGNCVIQYSCVVVLNFFSFITGQIYALQW